MIKANSVLFSSLFAIGFALVSGCGDKEESAPQSEGSGLASFSGDRYSTPCSDEFAGNEMSGDHTATFDLHFTSDERFSTTLEAFKGPGCNEAFATVTASYKYERSGRDCNEKYDRFENSEKGIACYRLKIQHLLVQLTAHTQEAADAFNKGRKPEEGLIEVGKPKDFSAKQLQFNLFSGQPVIDLAFSRGSEKLLVLIGAQDLEEGEVPDAMLLDKSN